MEETKGLYEMPQLKITVTSERCVIFMSENGDGADNMDEDIF